ncbi:PPE family protein [Mycobacterium rhizamassiliense]|jgi:PPE-repeat protein|uniref:PPE family protein n=1 Tax=Mycobacterium rhizamassiliense TaxID=1841860 RepID=A0A2U3NUU2_9MYCO|nr:PPE family protein [Mycobacterium rhizamassiliense]SPM35287.1 PPE family protein [Mycobacterium rhizamassiliense]
MDFGALCPEINSTRMYAGPGPGSLMGAAVAWGNLAAELQSVAASYRSVISGLVAGRWMGPTSLTMATAFGPYAAWMTGLAGRAAETAGQAQLAVEIYEAAYIATVPPPAVFANRTLLANLIATNFLGQNSVAIAACEAAYAEMWAQDAAAMYAYAAGSAEATQMTGYTDAPQVANPNGAAQQADVVGRSTGISGIQKAALQNVTQQVPGTLQNMATGGTNAGANTAATTTDSATSSLMSSLASSVPSSIPSYLMAAGTPLYGMSSILGMAQTGQGLMSAAANAANGAASAAGSAASGAAAGAGSLGRIGAGIFGSLGSAASLGPISVPAGWTSIIPAASTAASALPHAATLASATMPPSMMGGLPMTGSTTRPLSTPRYGIVPTIMSRPLAAGYV